MWLKLLSIYGERLGIASEIAAKINAVDKPYLCKNLTAHRGFFGGTGGDPLELGGRWHPRPPL